MPDRYLHCTFCGARFTAGRPWPRRCAACGESSYRNPTPVAVAVQPVGTGLLVVRRAIPPAEHRLALPGGYVNLGESWQEAVVRELSEETGLTADAEHVRLFDVLSAPDSTLLIFGLLPAVDTAPDDTPNDETLGVQVIERPTPLGFDLHTRVADRYFAEMATGLAAFRPG